MKRAEEVLFGYLTRAIEMIFELEKNSVFFSMSEDEGEDVFKRTPNSDAFPQCYLVFQTVDLTTNMLNSSALAHKGCTSNVLDSKGKPTGDTMRISLVPCKFQFLLEYKTNKLKDVLKFISNYAFSREFKSLDFVYTYRGLKLNAQVELVENVTIPPKSSLGSDAGAYEITVDFTVSGFISSVEGKYDKYLTGNSPSIDFSLHDDSDDTQTPTAENLISQTIITK